MYCLNDCMLKEHSPPLFLLFSKPKHTVMKKISLSLSLFCFVLPSNAQITKGNWMVGGNASFSSTKTESQDVSTATRTYLQLQPNIGRFFSDKFAAGLKALIQHQKVKFGSSPEQKQTFYGIGPFVRYYFLPVDQQVNLFSEGNYQHYISNPGSQNSNNYSIAVGTVVYLNNSVGIELSLGYSVTNNNEDKVKNKAILAGLGLQIHLERDR